VKGGMGAALAANVEKAKEILTTLVQNLSIPVTCKIRIRETVEETIAVVKEFESTGIKAIAIHARTRNERPQHRPHPEVIKAVVESGVKIPIICNGGSKEIEKYSDIAKYKDLCGASSIMIARAAEWNVTIFRPDGFLPLMDVIKMYLKLAVDYDAYAANTKYCIQNMLRELQETEMGKKFLEAQLMEQICEVFDLKDYCRQKQDEYQEKESKIRKGMMTVKNHVLYFDDDEPAAKKIKSDENLIIEDIAYIRSLYPKEDDLPKSILNLHLKKELNLKPVHKLEQKKSLFRSLLTIGDKKYMSSFWEKNKRSAEQCASLVACLHLNLVTRQQLIENGSLNPYGYNK
jgi:tRNA-dihydrouridine synthase 2